MPDRTAAVPAPARSPCLDVDGLVWGHRAVPLGGPWSATLVAGQVLAVLGPNGAGKSTLFRTLIGALPALAGVCRWRGLPAGGLSPVALASSVAFVPQLPQAGLDLVLADYAMLGRVARRRWFVRPTSADRATVGAILERLGIAPLAARPLAALSGGERQLAGIARALAQSPATLMLDEPMASLDFRNQALVLAQLAALADDGLAIVLSTHQPNHALGLADQVLALDGRGRCVSGAASEILRADTLGALYGVPMRQVDVAAGVAILPDIGALRRRPR